MRAHLADRSSKIGVTIVGPGRMGQALGRLLCHSGVPIDFVIARSAAHARRAIQFIGSGKAIARNNANFGSSKVILLTVPDSAIGPVATALARQREDWSGHVVLHTCGSQGTKVLGPFSRRRAAVGILHPFQTIPNPAAGVRSLRGCFWSVDGDRKAVAVARGWVKRLDGKAFRVPAGRKALYHLSAFLVCPTTITLMHQSERLLRRAGVPPRLIRPMLAGFVAEAAKNFRELGGRKALTGPVTRGDWKTLQRHVAMLRRYSPELIPVYRELARLMLQLAGKPAPLD